MKKIISMIICLVVLCAISVTAFADDDEEYFESGKKYYNDATDYYLDRNYDRAVENYHMAANDFYAMNEGRGMLLAAQAYTMAAKVSADDNWPEHEEMYLDYANDCYAYVGRHSSAQYIQPYEVFGGIELASKGSGFTLSNGNIAIIVGCASIIIFGTAGILLGRTIEKKKHSSKG